MIHTDEPLKVVSNLIRTKDAKAAQMNQYVPMNSLKKSNIPLVKLFAEDITAAFDIQINAHQKSMGNTSCIARSLTP
ncbi:hypothetical protein X759_30115 [Mesorhizobium sp. LSHC420B00]|nr:hypothetical protein X759_30115 [Mesorhizobium sp. LSHC420B00]